MAKRTSKNKGISRIDSGSTHGWFVRGYRNGKTYSKLYSDYKCGGKRKAYNEASEYRDKLLAELAEIPALPRKRSGPKKKTAAPSPVNTVPAKAAVVKTAPVKAAVVKTAPVKAAVKTAPVKKGTKKTKK
ncbi:MAG: hypothetical protein SFY80_03355 [Verrucomicrobiota bacterium]|nr:hypothetical protein [Verrucomicrobiota bacterium]